MRKILLTAMTVGALALPAAATADPPNGGGYCGASANGCAAAGAAGAQCDSGAGSGAFGAFGNFAPVGSHDFRGGADGTQTGLNNSAVCGNRQSH